MVSLSFSILYVNSVPLGESHMSDPSHYLDLHPFHGSLSFENTIHYATLSAKVMSFFFSVLNEITWLLTVPSYSSYKHESLLSNDISHNSDLIVDLLFVCFGLLVSLRSFYSASFLIKPLTKANTGSSVTPSSHKLI